MSVLLVAGSITGGMADSDECKLDTSDRRLPSRSNTPDRDSTMVSNVAAILIGQTPDSSTRSFAAPHSFLFIGPLVA